MSAPQAKRGYSPLAIGDTVQSGDMVYFASCWQPVTDFRDAVGKVIQQYDYRHCRPIVQPAARLLPKRSVKGSRS